MMEDKLVNASQFMFHIPSDKKSSGGFSGMLSGASLQTSSTLPDLDVTHRLLSMSSSSLDSHS
jgi:hypothetical protein